MAKSYEAYAGRNETAPNTLPCWIYGEMFRARNDFLHGNPVARDRLVVQSSGQNLYNFAAPQYRACLTAFLGLKKYGPPAQSNESIAKSPPADGAGSNRIDRSAFVWARSLSPRQAAPAARPDVHINSRRPPAATSGREGLFRRRPVSTAFKSVLNRAK